MGTHDLRLIGKIREYASALALPPGAYEVHMLYGIQPRAQRELAAAALDQKLGTLLRMHEEAFQQLGGVPRNSIVSLMNRTDPSANAKFAPPGCILPKPSEQPLRLLQTKGGSGEFINTRTLAVL